MTPSDRDLSDVLHETQAEIELREEPEREAITPPSIRDELDPLNREQAFEDLENVVVDWLAAYEERAA